MDNKWRHRNKLNMVHKTVDKDTWYIVYLEDESKIFYGFCPTGTRLDSGMPVVEEYDNEADWLIRLAELGITPEPPVE